MGLLRARPSTNECMLWIGQRHGDRVRTPGELKENCSVIKQFQASLQSRSPPTQRVEDGPTGCTRKESGHGYSVSGAHQ
eukprot:scaffold2636_cov340-Pavlova_lutheri.AAC.165